MQLLILCSSARQLSQSKAYLNFTVVIGSTHYPLLHVVFALKTYDAICVAVSLRLDASLCEPHQRTCGNMVNMRGNHVNKVLGEL